MGNWFLCCRILLYSWPLCTGCRYHPLPFPMINKTADIAKCPLMDTQTPVHRHLCAVYRVVLRLTVSWKYLVIFKNPHHRLLPQEILILINLGVRMFWTSPSDSRYNQGWEPLAKNISSLIAKQWKALSIRKSGVVGPVLSCNGQSDVKAASVPCCYTEGNRLSLLPGVSGSCGLIFCALEQT